jgi:hypothetical protein
MRLVIRLGLIVWICLSLFVLIVRVQVWQSDVAIWKEAVQWAPWKPRPWVNLGGAYARASNMPSALYCEREAIERGSRPTRLRDERIGGVAVAEADAALLLNAFGEHDAAIGYARRAMGAAPSLPDVVGAFVWITGGLE